MKPRSEHSSARRGGWNVAEIRSLRRPHKNPLKCMQPRKINRVIIIIYYQLIIVCACAIKSEFLLAYPALWARKEVFRRFSFICKLVFRHFPDHPMRYGRWWRFIIKSHRADPVMQNIRVPVQGKQPVPAARQILRRHRSLRRFERRAEVLHRWVWRQSSNSTVNFNQLFSLSCPPPTVCNRTYYGDVGRTYSIQVPTPQWNRIPFLCHLTFTASGHEQGDIVQVTEECKIIEAKMFGLCFAFSTACRLEHSRKR